MIRLKALCAMIMSSAAVISHAAAGDKLVLGMATSQSGAMAPFDGTVVEGIELAVEEINAAGGIGGKIKIEIASRDVRSNAEQHLMVVRELVEQDVNVMITTCDDEASLQASHVLNDAQIPAFSTCASSPNLAALGGDFMFVNVPGDNIQATVSATYAREQGYENAYIVYSPESFYTSMPLYFADVFGKLGGTVVGEGVYTMGQTDYSALVSEIQSLKPQPEVIMTSAYEPDFPALLSQLREAGVKIPVIGSDGVDSPTTFALGQVASGLVFTTAGYATPGSQLEAFNAKYRAKHGKDSETVFNALGYDLVKIIEAAVLAADSIEPVALQRAIIELDKVQGATSEITYRGTNGMPVRQVALVRVQQDGGRELLGQPAPNAALVPAPRI